ncbi:sugar phosphate isomerase/epimerase [Paenibacillus sp. GD4]|uniref:sugar phosphate isomerase/epimerase family protein n=1 Tax=Paenibacillus sp. GD4 TaxID=3068890 RepID=UPI002796A775|nr:sugar phosphate isomerase/epimerase [Paenibacillus sp. GD4]MDQ1913911.1 sugar phosphate isomerase/epimerase [Paenibacillus sp. GD4]
MKNNIAVQLYTLREECKSNFPKVLREISQMGYDGVQFAGFHDYDPLELKAVISETGLGVAGMHYSYKFLAENTAQAIEEAKLFGTPDLVCSSMIQELRSTEGYIAAKEELNAIAKRIKPKGMRLSYHNHAYEFDTSIDGRDALSYLLEPAEENDILAEIDVYWVKRGGRDVTSFLKPYVGRMPIIHLKDMSDDAEKSFAPVGTGTIDFTSILQWGEASGVEWYVVEQDVCKSDPMECVRTSLAHLSKQFDALKMKR